MNQGGLMNNMLMQMLMNNMQGTGSQQGQQQQGQQEQQPEEPKTKKYKPSDEALLTTGASLLWHLPLKRLQNLVEHLDL